MRLCQFAVALAVALFATAADAKVLISVDKSTQRMTVSVDGAMRWTWPVSTGRRGRVTPAGSFQAFRMEEDHYSKEWDDAPMPHSIFFTKRGHAIHGSFDIKRLGSPASAGCVRLHPDNAKQLFALVKEQGVLNTTVVIAGQEPRPAPAVARQTPRMAPSTQQQQRQAPPARVARPAPQYQYEYEYEYVTPPAPRGYRRGAYQQPAPGYYALPPPPPGYMYQQQPPQGYYYYYR
ncbi:MAG: L,D-transpeptidase [Xanthobacteraceae bacterium]